MPGYAVQRLADTIGALEGKRVAVLGAAYRGGVKETAFSGVFGVVDELTSRGAEVTVHDPLYDDAELERLGFTPYALGSACDAAIVQTNHVEYRSITPDSLPGARAVVDGRNVLDLTAFEAAGVPVLRLGSPDSPGE